MVRWRKFMKMLPGVYKSAKKDGSISYRASITFRSKHISLGSFKSEEQAHYAYLDAAEIINNSNIFTPDNYSASLCKMLPFSKWVVLNNFKNNGIYIKTPIYLRKTFFNYYISEHDVLTFDADDLFYYSDHSILRYENIEILNPYQGVTIERKSEKTCYVTRIHINGNFTAGRYPSIEEAAIAYNKAADLLEKKGVTKKF